MGKTSKSDTGQGPDEMRRQTELIENAQQATPDVQQEDTTSYPDPANPTADPDPNDTEAQRRNMETQRATDANR